MHLKNHILLFALLLSVNLFAQEETTTKLSPKEFSIPPSPVFDLMGVTPSQINRTSDIKDFKVDWSFRSWKLSPNIAIQSQPFWEIFFHRKDLSKYQQASGFMRKLASLDVSLGTVQNDDNDRRIGYALKLNLLKKYDPLLAKNFYDDISTKFSDEKKELELAYNDLKKTLDTATNILEKNTLRNQLFEIKEQIRNLNTRRNNEINDRSKIYISEKWNTASLDIAVGRVYTYQVDSTNSLSKLRLNRNTGMGIWLNGGFPIGKKIMVSGLFRSTWYEEELNFLLRNTSTQEEVNALAVAENQIYSIGLNLRYGSPLYSFFAEFLFEKKALKTPVEALKDAFKEPSNMEIVDASVRWNIVHPNNLTIGGDWKMSKNVVLTYGLRWVFDKNGKMQQFIPIAGISCMMR